jgi:hypothetical protein
VIHLPEVVLGSLLVLSVPLFTSRARACGASGPDGVSACSLEEHEEAGRARWRVGASGVYTSTALNFGGGLRADETRVATLAFLAYEPLRRLSIQAGAGASLGGQLSFPSKTYDFSPGFIADVGISYRLIDGQPFLVLSSVLSSLTATTRANGDASGVGYEAFDLRAGVLFGGTLFGVLSPYAVARIFGGPVFWRYQGSAVTGTDVSHYQVGAGIALLIVRHVDFYAEGVPLGERAVSAGLSVAF